MDYACATDRRRRVARAGTRRWTRAREEVQPRIRYRRDDRRLAVRRARARASDGAWGARTRVACDARSETAREVDARDDLW